MPPCLAESPVHPKSTSSQRERHHRRIASPRPASNGRNAVQAMERQAAARSEQLGIPLATSDRRLAALPTVESWNPQ